MFTLKNELDCLNLDSMKAIFEYRFVPVNTKIQVSLQII